MQPSVFLLSSAACAMKNPFSSQFIFLGVLSLRLGVSLLACACFSSLLSLALFLSPLPLPPNQTRQDLASPRFQLNRCRGLAFHGFPHHLHHHSGRAAVAIGGEVVGRGGDSGRGGGSLSRRTKTEFPSSPLSAKLLRRKETRRLAAGLAARRCLAPLLALLVPLPPTALTWWC